MDSSDPNKSAKMWSEFVANMVPVITRVVKFCKKLPGKFHLPLTPSPTQLVKERVFLFNLFVATRFSYVN